MMSHHMRVHGAGHHRAHMRTPVISDDDSKRHWHDHDPSLGQEDVLPLGVPAFDHKYTGTLEDPLRCTQIKMSFCHKCGNP